MSPPEHEEDGMDSEKWPEWCCSYHFEGSKWGLTIPARSAEEASKRLRAIGMTAQVDGELMQVLPAYPGVGLYVRLSTFLRNLIAGGRDG